MSQKISDFLISQTIRAKDLSSSTRFFRLILFLVILAIPTLLCGFLVSFKAAFQMWLLLLAAIVPLVTGFYLIGKHQWKSQKLAFLSTTGLIGFVAFELTIIGMLIDERAVNFSMQYVLTTAAFAGIVFFIVSTIGSLLFAMLFRALNGNKQRR
jgi:FtsH-binding integral membrane protein